MLSPETVATFGQNLSLGDSHIQIQMAHFSSF